MMAVVGAALTAAAAAAAAGRWPPPPPQGCEKEVSCSYFFTFLARRIVHSFDFLTFSARTAENIAFHRFSLRFLGAKRRE